MDSQEESKKNEKIKSLISFEDFKSLMGIDDRDEKTARFCLVTATLNIEKYCNRKFLHKQYFEIFKWSGNILLILNEYPVSEILAVYTYNELQVLESCVSKEPCGMILEPEFYRPMIGNDFNKELPFELLLSTSLKPYLLKLIKVIYSAGYSLSEVPEDLQAACLELASWNFNRYKGRRVGITGNLRGSGVRGIHAGGEHFELSMPESVKVLIEPYKRKTI